METLRLHPPDVLTPPHYALEDCNVAGYKISKGTIIMVNIWSIGRDLNTWENPEVLSPERFLGKEVDISGHNFTLLPFGAGRRMCPGYNLSLRIVTSTLANLIHGFNWKLPDGVKVEDVCLEEVYGLTTHLKVPLAIVLESALSIGY